MCNNQRYIHTELLYKACNYITLMTHKNVMIYNRISPFFSFQFKTTRKWPTKVSFCHNAWCFNETFRYSERLELRLREDAKVAKMMISSQKYITMLSSMRQTSINLSTRFALFNTEKRQWLMIAACVPCIAEYAPQVPYTLSNIQAEL